MRAANPAHIDVLDLIAWHLERNTYYESLITLLKPFVTYFHSFIHSFIHSLTHSSIALQPFVGPGPLLQFRNLFYTVGRTPWKSDQPVARTLHIQDNTNTE
jgi:hypothetical protein